jgi:glycosyltransferase involved in cell wall biosynthesis
MTGAAGTLRVALVSETWFPQVNGVSRTLEKLVEYLAGRGDTVRLFIPRYPEGEKACAGIEAVSFSSFPLPLYPEVRVVLAAPRRLRRELGRFRPDVVHIATEGPLGRAALAAARRLDLPVVSSYHTNFTDYLRQYGFGWLEGAAWRYLRGFHNATAATFCPTPSIRKLLRARGFRGVEVWGRGVDNDRFHPGKRDLELRRRLGISEEGIVLACCGRLAAEKNLETLLAAWKCLPPAAAARLVLIGDGPLRSRIERQGDPRIILAGYRHGEELARYYASADLFVFPSLSETFGNVLLEAMASGLPAIGFDVPGPRDVIRHGETGLVVGEASPEAFAWAMESLATDPGRLGEMSVCARRYAAAQDWETINDKVRRRYLQVAGAVEASAPLPDATAEKGVRSCR